MDTSMVSSLTGTANEYQATNVGTQIATAVLRQQQDLQKAEGEALLKMIQKTPSPDGTGKVVDLFA
jgi:hypothetical protein